MSDPQENLNVQNKRKDEGVYAKFLEQILDHLPTPVYVKDHDAKFVFSNRAHDELIGKTETELIGKSDADFYPAETAATFLANDRGVITSGITSDVVELANSPEGLTMPVLSRKARMVLGDGSAYMVGMNFDLTEVKKREEQYRALAETVPVGVIQFEENGSVSFANPLLLAMFDFGEDEYIFAKFLAALGNAAGFPGEASRQECELKDRKGQLRRVLVISSGWLYLSKLGKRSAIVSVVDISENAELKRINDEVLRLNLDLAASMQQLRDVQEALVKKGRMEQMGQLTATIAHELRNPMGAIRTAAFVVERRLKGKGMDVEQQLQRINNGIIRCDAIITQLLDFSRTKKIIAQPADLDAWLEATVAEEAKRFSPSLTITCVLTLNGLLVPFDQDRMRRAVVNLMSNAAEALVGMGDTPLATANGPPTIEIKTSSVDAFAIISVTDNGPGMNTEILSKVREPLFTTKSFGTGLGVPAIEQIARQHGGSLDIISSAGQGACFSLRLPLNEQTVEEAA